MCVGAKISYDLACRPSRCLLTTTIIKGGHHLYWICWYITSWEVVKATCMEPKDHCSISEMDLTTLTLVLFLHYCFWESYQFQGKSMCQTCSWSSHLFIFGWDSCHCSHTRRKGLILLQLCRISSMKLLSSFKEKQLFYFTSLMLLWCLEIQKMILLNTTLCAWNFCVKVM